MIYLLIVLYIAVIYLQLVPIIKNKERNKAIAYMIFLILSFVLNALLILNVKITNPSVIIKNIISRIVGT